MPQYYFHVRNGAEAFMDREGSIHPSLGEACSEALRIAGELVRDEEAYAGYFISVVDQEGFEVASMPVDKPRRMRERGSHRR
jgi:hypothetical protein